MTLTIGTVEIAHAAVLAPMSGVTDLPFRRAVRRAGRSVGRSVGRYAKILFVFEIDCVRLRNGRFGLRSGRFELRKKKNFPQS